MKHLFHKLLRFFTVDIAMDLGTANTLLYTRKHGVVINEPSVVALSAKDGRVLAVGAQARAYPGRTPLNVRAVRPLKNGVIADFDVTRAMIASFVNRAITGLKLARPGMVICIPSGITQVEKKAVIDAAILAGAREVSLVEEPMAAALGADLPVAEPVGSMVLDIGGGTSEVAVLSLGGVAVCRSIRVAGDAMNMAVQRYIHDKFKLDIGENTAEQVKIAIGSAIPRNDIKELEVAGKDIVLGRPRVIRVQEGEIREAIAEHVRAILNTLMRALERTPPELAIDIGSRGILLAGGGSLLWGLDKFLSSETGLHVYLDKDPLTTVLRGTAKAMLNRDAYKSAFIN